MSRDIKDNHVFKFSYTNYIMLTHKLAKENVVMKRKAYVSANQSFLTTVVNLSKQTTSAAQLVSNFLCLSALFLCFVGFDSHGRRNHVIN